MLDSRDGSLLVASPGRCESHDTEIAACDPEPVSMFYVLFCVVFMLEIIGYL